MTFFTTINNLGTRWPISLNLWLVDMITYKNCMETKERNSTVHVWKNSTSDASLDMYTCYEQVEVDACESAGGACVVSVDGFYILSIGCVIIGYLWYVWAGQAVRKWQQLDVSEWRVHKKSTRGIEKEMENIG